MLARCALGAFALTVISARAADWPQADWFFGYSFLRIDAAQPVPAFTANGGISTFAWNFTRRFAMEAELGGYHNGNVNNRQFDSTTFEYLFGPRVSVNRAKMVDPYLHVLLGGNYASTSICCQLVVASDGTLLATGERVGAGQKAFALAAGGGLDIKVNKRILVRPIQLDYYLTRYELPSLTVPPGRGSSHNQSNLRYAMGFLINFGGVR